MIKSFTYSEVENANDSRMVMSKMEKHCIGDSSQIGLGAALMQNGHPIAYASRALTETQSRYGQIEKEMLTIVVVSTYLYRMTISVIVVTAINMGPVFTTQRTATTPGPTLFE